MSLNLIHSASKMEYTSVAARKDRHPPYKYPQSQLGSQQQSHPISQSGLSFSGFLLIFVAFLLFSVGCVFIFNVSSAEALDVSGSKALHASLVRQLVFAGIGALIGFFAYKIGFQLLWNYLHLVVGLICVALLLCFVPGIGLSANGSHRWIGFAGYYLQPSEFAKFIVPLFALKQFWALAQKKEQITWKSVVKNYIAIALPLSLIIIEPDNRSTILSGSGVVVACFLSKLPVRFWLVPMIGFGLATGAIALQLPYVQRRIEVFMNPEADTSGKGYQPYQAKITAGSGRLTGRGLGEGMQKFSYLPEAQNDYIVAIIGEECGFWGVATLIHLYGIMMLAGFWIACRCPKPHMQLASGIILYMIGIQVFINLGVVSGLLPSTGLNLPFVSQGGSSLWTCTLAIALLLNIDRERRHKKS